MGGAAVGWFDSHCHLPYERLDEPAAEIAAARVAGVVGLITVGTDLDQSSAALELACRHDDVWATIGLHPHDASDGLDPVLDLLTEVLADPVRRAKVVGVGECGLDYHYDHSPREAQRAVFAAQIDAAQAHDLTLVIHTREAWADTFALLDEVGMPPRTVFHCFTGGPDEAESALARGAYLSFSGIVSFPSAGDVQAAAALCPPDRVLVETDSPYLAPVPHRGRTNRPALLPHVGQAVAAARGEPAETIAVASTANARAAFSLG